MTGTDAQGAPVEPGTPRDTSMSWSEVRASMKRFWYLLPLLCCVMVAAALFAAQGEAELYRSEGDVVFAPSPRLEETYEAVDVLSVLSARVPQGTFVELIDSPVALQDAVAEAQADPDNLEVAEVHALIAQEANIVTVQVDAATASEAAALNTTLVDNTITRFEQIYPVLSVSRLDAPSTPEGPLNPSPLNDIILALVVATLLWAITATLLGRLLR